jgi:hypothetical protein
MSKPLPTLDVRIPAFLGHAAWFVLVLFLAGCSRGTTQESVPQERVERTLGTVATLTSIQLNPPTASVPVPVAQTFTATGIYSDGSKGTLSDLAWSVSDTTVATVDSSGLVTPLGRGSVTVTATDASVLGPSGVPLSATAALTVTAANLVSLTVTPATKQIPIGTSQNFVAMGTFSDGTKFPLDPSAVTWTTTNSAIATVASAGGTTGLAEGVVGVTATNAATGIAGRAILTVGDETLVSIAVTPPSVSMPKGLTEALTATGTYSDDSTFDLTGLATWSTSAGGVAKVSNATGSAGVATAEGVGTATLTATLSGVKGSATVTVTAALLTSVAVTPLTASLPNGTTLALTATGTYSDGSSKNITKSVTWTSASPTTVAVSNATGSIGVATALGVGTTIVVAMDPTTGFSAGATLTVTAAVLKSLAVTPASASVPLGETPKAYTATGTFTDSTTQNMTASVLWTSSTPSVATISNAPGSAGVAMTASVGTTSITALDPVSGIGSKAATLKVTAAVLTSIVVTPPTPTVPKGFSQAFAATGLYSDGSSQDITASVTWKVTSGSATISNAVGSNGVASTTKAGSNTVQASLGTIKGTATLTVTSATVSSIGVTPAAQSIALGTTLAYVATGVFTDGTKMNLTNLVTWSASNGDATVSNAVGSQGVATATAVGTTTVSALYAPTAVTGSTTLTVTPATLVSLAVSPAGATLPAGDTSTFTAVGTFTDRSTAAIAVTWSTADATVLTVSNAGGSAGVATAGLPGMTLVTATDPVSGLSASAAVTVTPAVLVSITISLPSSTMPLGTTQQLVATGTYSDHTQQTLTGSVTWSGSSGAISVSTSPAIPPGFVVALSVGSATVTATEPASGISGSASVTVTPAVLVSIAVSPEVASVPAGLTQQFTATGTYTDGTTQGLTSAATWSVTGPTATISNAAGSSGLATALTVGTTGVAATDSATGIQGAATLTTTAAVLESIQVTPVAPSVASGLGIQLAATGTFSDGSSVDLTSTVTWSASGNVSVSNAPGLSGLATGGSAGSGVVTATDPSTGIAASDTITVTPAPAETFAATGILRDFHTGANLTETNDGDLGIGGYPIQAETNPPEQSQDWEDIAGTNERAALPLTFANGVEADPRVYTFSSSAFYPADGELFGNEGAVHNDYFTYELHAAIAYEPGATLQFASSNELLVFINGYALSTLTSSSSGPWTVNLDTVAALGKTGEFVAGSTMRFDLFYMHSGQATSDLEVEVTAPICSALSHTLSQPVAASSLNLFGSASVASNGTIDVLPSGVANTAGAAWRAAPLAWQGFRSTFTALITADKGSGKAGVGEGFALVLSATPGVGLTGGNLGYVGLGPSVAIEFDTFQEVVFDDPAGPQISVHTRGNQANSASETASIAASTPATLVMEGLIELEALSIGVEYDPGTGPTGWLRVFAADEVAMAFGMDGFPQTPLVEAQVDNSLLLSAVGTGHVYIGFTSASGATTTALVAISNWTIGELTASANTTSLPAPATNHAGQPGVVTVQALNASGNPVGYGGAAACFAGSLDVDTISTPALVTDNLDGTYAVSYGSSLIGEGTLGVTYQGTNIVGSPATVLVSP